MEIPRTKSLLTAQQGILSSVFDVVGVSDNTRLEIHDILEQVYLSSGDRGVAGVVKKWSKAVRILLADEPSTRGESFTDFGYCRSVLNLRDRIRGSGSLSELEFESAVSHQGNRPIPPFLLDVGLVRCLLPSPTFVSLSKIVIFGNIGRTTAPPERSDLIANLDTFCDNVESDLDLGIDFSASAKNLFSKLTGRVPKTSEWSLSSHSSLEYSRQHGGKTKEIVDRVVADFCSLMVRDLIGERPSADLFDILGNLVITPETWDKDLNVQHSFYLDMVSNENDEPDSRLGPLGLLWSIIQVMELGATSNSAFPGLSYQSFEISIPDDLSFRCRISLQAEEGWKSRILTIGDISLYLIGQAFRGFVDPVMKSDRLTEIGLTDKVKLYSVMSKVSGHAKTSYVTHFNPLPEVAESVDLTTATDTPPRRVVRQFIDAFIHGRDSPFIRFAVSLGCSRRAFVHAQAFADCRVPVAHNSAIFMGEGCSGTFLNSQSMWVRSIVHGFRERFPGLDDATWTSSECVSFVRGNQTEIQSFLDSHDFGPHPISSQSGDDVIIFSTFRLVNYLRILYTMIGMKPSGSTWYSSTQFATFTEEAAIRTFDSNGWKFIDSIKPRLFNCHMTVEMEDPIISRIRQIKGTCQYVSSLPDIRKVIGAVDRIIESIPRLEKAIRKEQISSLMPCSMGGIDHPLIYDSSVCDLTEVEKKILFGLSQSPVWSYVHRKFLSDDDPEGLDLILANFVSELQSYPIVSLDNRADFALIDVSTIPTPPTMVRFREIDNLRKATLQQLGYQMLSDALPSIAAKFRLTTMLREPPVDRIKKPVQLLKNRFLSLRLEFQHLEVPEDSYPLIWNWIKNYNNNINSLLSQYAISRDVIKELCEGHNLVSTSLRVGSFLPA